MYLFIFMSVNIRIKRSQNVRLNAIASEMFVPNSLTQPVSNNFLPFLSNTLEDLDESFKIIDDSKI